VRTFTFLLLTVNLSVSCTVGPNYKRPATVVPANFRAPDPPITPFLDSEWHNLGMPTFR